MGHLNAPSRSFNELALRYVACQASVLSSSQLNQRLDHLSQHAMVFFGAMNMADITPAHVQKFIYHLEMKGLKTSAIQACLVSFRACMKFAIQQKWPVAQQLSRPLIFKQDEPISDGPHLSADEFNFLFQDLVQDMTKDLYH